MKALDYEGRRNVSGERVRQKRTERKITQAELAARVQCEGVKGIKTMPQDNLRHFAYKIQA